MARKKASPASRTLEIPSKTSRDPSPDAHKMENLKTLNQLLLKETMERRFQVDQLRSEIEELHRDLPFVSDLERGVCQLVLSAAVAEEKVRLNRRLEAEAGLRLDLEAAAVEKARALEERVAFLNKTLVETEERLGLVSREKDVVKRELESAAVEKAAVVEKARTLEESVGLVSKTLVETEERLGFVNREKDEVGRQLELMAVEKLAAVEKAISLEERVGLVEKTQVETEERLGLMSRERDEVKKKLESVEARKAATVEKLRALEEKEGLVRKTLVETQERLGLVSGEKDEVKRELESVTVEKVAALERVSTLEERVGLVAKSLEDTEERLGWVSREKDEVNRELASAVVEKAAAVETVRALKERVDLVSKTLVETEERLGLVSREKDEVKMELESVVSERDSNQRRLDSTEEEVAHLKLNVGNLEFANSEIREDLVGVMCERDALERERENWNKSRESLERLNEDLARKMEDLDRKHSEEVELLLAEKTESAAKVLALEEETRRLLEVNFRLEGEISTSKAALDLLKRKEEELRLQIIEVEKRNEELQEEFDGLRVKTGLLQKEKEEKEISFASKIRESTLKMDDLKEKLGEISREKDKIEQVRAVQDVEILELKKEVAKLSSGVSELQYQCKNYMETNTQLLSEKDEAQRDLGQQREEAGDLRLQAEELKKSKDGILEELERLKVELNTVAVEKEEGKRHSDLLAVEKASLEKSLLDAREKFEAMEKKMRAAEMVSNKALALLKSTSGKMNGLEKAGENGHIDDEEIRPFVSELESINMSFKSREIRIEELQSAVANAEKKRKGALWMWFYPATTTVFAAISLAYASRGR